MHDKNLNVSIRPSPEVRNHGIVRVVADVSSGPRRRPPFRGRRRINGARQRGLVRLVLLVGVVGWLVVLAARGWFGGGSDTQSTSAARASRPAASARLKGTTESVRLPQPLHGATAVSTESGLLVIGGADRTDVSTDKVVAIDPSAGGASVAGTLIQPLHDAAAATLGGRTMVFGGGAATTYDTVQELTPGGVAQQIGHLPGALSDLSAVTTAGAAYVLGGYDGQRPSASVYRTVDGRRFTTAGSLPTAVRYTAVAAIGDRIYAFGGELATGGDTDQIQEYDTGTGRASVAGHLPQAVSHASAVVLNGVIYVLGGRRGGTASSRIYLYDPARRAVLPAGRLPAPVFDGAAATAAGVGYLAGGIGARGTSVDSVLALSENH